MPAGHTPHGPTGGRPGRRGYEESVLRGGLPGVALVTVATIALAAVGALIAFAVALLY